MRRPARVAALLSGLVLAASCDSSPGTVSGPPPPVTSSPERSGRPDGPAQRYVALGDSFTAAPLVPVTDVADGCFRSDGNYPSLLAARLDLDLTDVSCSGATTDHLVRWQRTVQDASVPPQLRAVDRNTDLVTIGIGGNDLGLFATLVQTCLGLRAQDPGGAPCAHSTEGRRLLASTPRIGDNVQRALERVQHKAPQARVVLVGYPRIAPPEGTCPQLLPFATGDVAFGDDVLRAIDAAMSDAAESAGVDYLDLYRASAGHDVCSAEPWVNGRRTEAGVAAAYHPLASGAEATATLLEELLAPG
jgi:lysophospholipase L1-like esterase